MKMKNRFLAFILAAIMVMTAISAFPVGAEISGDWKYEILENDSIVLTGYRGTETALSIPDSIDGHPVTEIREAFKQNENLESVVIPQSVKRIGYNAFSDCDNLNQVELANGLKEIGYDAFRSCDSLNSITIPTGVKTIESNAFYYCRSLEIVSIPDTVEQIGQDVFSYTAIYENSTNWDNGVLYIGKHLIRASENIAGDYSIRNNTISIASGAFARCNWLSSVSIPDTIKIVYDHTFAGCSELKTVVLPRRLDYLGEGAFSGCNQLQDITIPFGIPTICEFTFNECSSLTSIHIPDSVKSIERDAFCNCKALYEISIPPTITLIDSWAFNNCTSIEKVYYGGSRTQWNNISIEWNNDCLKNANIVFEKNDPGDVNGDGKINSRDVIAVMKAVLAGTTASELPAADVSGDGKINSRDVILVMKAVLAA